MDDPIRTLYFWMPAFGLFLMHPGGGVEKTAFYVWSWQILVHSCSLTNTWLFRCLHSKVLAFVDRTDSDAQSAKEICLQSHRPFAALRIIMKNVTQGIEMIHFLLLFHRCNTLEVLINFLLAELQFCLRRRRRRRRRHVCLWFCSCLGPEDWCYCTLTYRAKILMAVNDIQCSSVPRKKGPVLRVYMAKAVIELMWVQIVGVGFE